ncbi:MAG: serine/threonine protein kinase, partial [candidate division NC10 bacterium]|nr:serine/threonine protein kinase [candidate division NC10 bacterium]
GQHAFLDRPVAIKEMKSRLRRDSELQDRFQREARAAANLPHRNIVQVYDFWRDREHRYLVMELVEGLDAGALLRRAGRIPTYAALALVGQVCRGLAFAHERSIIHRDLKPSNLLITKGGVAKLGDFGIAHLMDTPGLTQPGQTLGTLAYMSPEQIRGERLTPASDVFSLGIVLYELLTGRRPFVEDEAESVTAKIIADRPVPPRRVKSGIPRAVQRIVLKCLRKRPDRRFQTCTALERAIRRILGGTPAAWEALLRRYFEMLPSDGEAPPHLGRRLRTPGHLLRRLRRFSVAAGLAAAVAWGGLALTGPPSRLAPAVQWVQSLLPAVPSWRTPEASGPERGARPARPRPTRPSQRAPASDRQN